MATQHLVEAGYYCLGGCPELLSGPWTGPGAWYTEGSPLDIPLRTIYSHHFPSAFSAPLPLRNAMLTYPPPDRWLIGPPVLRMSLPDTPLWPGTHLVVIVPPWL